MEEKVLIDKKKFDELIGFLIGTYSATKKQAFKTYVDSLEDNVEQNGGYWKMDELKKYLNGEYIIKNNE